MNNNIPTPDSSIRVDDEESPLYPLYLLADQALLTDADQDTFEGQDYVGLCQVVDRRLFDQNEIGREKNEILRGIAYSLAEIASAIRSQQQRAK